MAIFHTRWWAKEQLARGGALAGEVLGNIITLCKGFIALKIKIWSNVMSIIWWLDWYIRQDKHIHISTQVGTLVESEFIFTNRIHVYLRRLITKNQSSHGSESVLGTCRWFPGIRPTQLTIWEPPTIGKTSFFCGVDGWPYGSIGF